MATNTESITESTNTIPRRLYYAQIVQNFRLVWLDGSIDETNDDYRNSITTLQEVVNIVNTFVDVDKCVDFIRDHPEMVFVVISGKFAQHAILAIQDIPQVYSIYICSENDVSYEKSSKVCGVYTNVTTICDELKKDARKCDRNLISISYINTSDGITNKTLDTLEPSFMYTQILKEILFTIDFEPVHFSEFITYCRQQFVDSPRTINSIDKIEKEYYGDSPISWYTGTGFLYSMLNKALRTMEANSIVNMGFFVRDLHNQIAQLHTAQLKANNYPDPFIVYRGQSLSKTDFDKLTTTSGGLISFNSFLSTSLQRDVSLAFAKSSRNSSESIGILFEITIDPSIALTPFANIKDTSRFEDEEEILFSMHSVFRIGQLKQIEENDCLWQVQLILTSDTDPQLQNLTEFIRHEIKGPTGWFRLAFLMVKIAQFDKAEQLFQIILGTAIHERKHIDTYYQLEFAGNCLAKSPNALTDYVEALHLHLRTFITEHTNVAQCHNMIGLVYFNKGEYSTALSHYEQAFKIFEKTLPVNQPNLAGSYNNIGQVHESMAEYSKALSYYEKALEIQEKILPASHPNLGTSCNNVAFIHHRMAEYSKALSYYKKALQILEITLPANHPDIALFCNNIGGVYHSMGEQSKALSYCEKALEIREKTLPPNHPDLATSYNNIGWLRKRMGESSKALSYYKKALEIREKALPATHPWLATSYNNIGAVYYSMREHSTARSYYEKALEILEKALPANHPDLATSYNNIGQVYDCIGEHSKALSYCEKALDICEKTLPANHPDLAVYYNSIGHVRESIGEYSKALSYYEKALEIREKALPRNHPDLANSYNSVGMVYYNMREYSKALSYYEKALEIREKALPRNHPDLANSYNNVGMVYYNMREYSKALPYFEKALNILEKTLPANHPDLALYYNNIGTAYHNMREYSKALSYYEKALEIREKTLPENHPDLAESYNNVAVIYQSTGDYSVALVNYERALNILKRRQPLDLRMIDEISRNIKKCGKK